MVCGVCLQSRKHSTNRKTAGQASVPTPLPMADSESGCGPHYLCLSWLPLIKVGNDRCFSYICITEDPNTWEKQLRDLWLISSQSFRRLNLGSIGPRYLGRASQLWEHMGRCLLHGWPGRRRKDKAGIETAFTFSLVCSGPWDGADESSDLASIHLLWKYLQTYTLTLGWVHACAHKYIHTYTQAHGQTHIHVLLPS